MRRSVLVGLGFTFFAATGLVVSLWNVSGVQATASPQQTQRRSSTAIGMTEAAQMFLASLDPAQRDLATYDYDAEERLGWHFIPKAERKGMQVKEMSEAQRDAALKLLRSCLSRAGYTRATRIMDIEDLLAELERGRGTQIRDSARYFVTIFGDVTTETRWGLSFEGHHMSLNFVVEGEEVVSTTPMFFGINPSVVNRDFETFRRGTRVIADEELLAFELLDSLSEEQFAQTLTAEQAAPDIRNAGVPHPPTDPAEGISYAQLSTVQQSRLEGLVEAYLRHMANSVAETRRGEIRDAGWENVKFCWQGATRPGIGHAYRIQGPTFLIEFNNNQADADGNPASHIHAVWRDPRGDFALPISN